MNENKFEAGQTVWVDDREYLYLHKDKKCAHKPCSVIYCEDDHKVYVFTDTSIKKNNYLSPQDIEIFKNAVESVIESGHRSDYMVNLSKCRLIVSAL